MIKYYIDLIKPGIVIGNVMSAIGGFLLASKDHVLDYYVLINVVIGLSFVISSSCILNNIIDRDIDSIMNRTKNRVLAQSGLISVKTCIICVIVLDIFGFLFLGYTKNLLTVLLTAIGYFIYICLYSLWMKRKSIYSVWIGSISGSMPPVIGYCTVTNQLDIGSLILLLIFSFWQIPHSYSINIFRTNDYEMALIPTFFKKKGIESTRMHMIICILGFSISTILLTIQGYTSYLFLYIISVLNLLWLYVGFFYYKLVNNNYIVWSRKMFILSIVIISILNVLLILDTFMYHLL